MIRTNQSTTKSKKKTQQKSIKDNESKSKSKKELNEIGNKNKDNLKVINKKNTIDNSGDKKTKTDVQTNKSIVMPALPATKKLERSNSFFLTRKLSKIYNTLTGSKDNLNKIPENEDNQTVDANPFKFTRSASMGIIPLRKSYRRSMRESKLEQLSEENVNDLRSKSPSNAGDNIDSNAISASQQTLDTESCASRPYASSECLDKVNRAERKNSFNLLSSLKRTFSVTPSKRKKPHNPKWSASLMNLQQIDHMISYEDLSFIDYDKFNTYEASLERHISQTELNKQLYRQSMPESSLITAKYGNSDDEIESTDTYFTNYPTVKRRPRKSVNINDVNTNFDKPKNVYRQSLDDEKLRFLNDINRKSFRWSNPFEEFNKKDEDLPFMDDTGGAGSDIVDGNVFNDFINDPMVNKKNIIQRCISCNSLRRTQSMNDINICADVQKYNDNKVSNFLFIYFSTYSRRIFMLIILSLEKSK